jgi:hypothetical protein
VGRCVGTRKEKGNESEQEKTERMGAFGAGKRVVRGRGDLRGILVRRSWIYLRGRSGQKCCS